MTLKPLSDVTKEMLKEEKTKYVTIMLRAKCKMTQREFSKAIKTTQANLCRYERGKIRPSAAVMKRIIDFAKSVGVLITFNDFFGE
jgi:transcriptional regulator with XRE-family HTH domain